MAIAAALDAHLHVWDRSRSRYAWLDDAPELLRADHTLDQAFADLAPHGFTEAVLVQADETLAETAYLLDLAAADARLRGAVCYLPLEDPGIVAAQLSTAPPGLVGVRNLTHDRADADWVLGPEQARSIDLIERRGLPLDYVAVLPRHRENLVTLARRHPGLTLVLDHLGTPPVGATDGDRERWEDQLAELAACPNVVAKVSGLYRAEGSEPLRADELDGVLGAVLAAFGAARLMVGSDWPVCRARGGAAGTLGALVAAVGRLADEQAAALLRGTATRVYGLQT